MHVDLVSGSHHVKNLMHKPQTKKRKFQKGKLQKRKSRAPGCGRSFLAQGINKDDIMPHVNNP